MQRRQPRSPRTQRPTPHLGCGWLPDWARRRCRATSLWTGRLRWCDPLVHHCSSTTTTIAAAAESARARSPSLLTGTRVAMRLKRLAKDHGVAERARMALSECSRNAPREISMGGIAPLLSDLPVRRTIAVLGGSAHQTSPMTASSRSCRGRTSVSEVGRHRVGRGGGRLVTAIELRS